MVLSIASKWFSAGVVLDEHDRVVRAAPILKYMQGWPRQRVEQYVRIRKWTLHEVVLD